MQNLFLRVDSIKSSIPNIYSTSKDKLGSFFSSFMTTEADYLIKTENTEKELRDLLTSKMDVEIILGLKFIMGVFLLNKLYFSTF